MTPNWIKELTYSIFYGKEKTGKSPDEIVEEINGLLRRAALETDNEELQDEIWSKIRDDTV